MFLAVDNSGNFWDGWGWSQRGREFLSIAALYRSLHDEGSDPENVMVLEIPIYATTTA
jgi:hypothetical protein